MPKFLGDLDTVDLSSDPSASTGVVYFNTTSNAFKYYNGSSWVTIGSQTVVESPTGSIIHWVGAKSAIPSGWLACDGTSYSTATYPDLYAVIATYFGGTPGSSFNIPDLRSAAMPMRTSGLAGVAVGNTGGGSYTWINGSADPFGSLTHSSDSAAHTHTWTDDSQGDHTHAYDHSHTLTVSSYSSNGDHSHTHTDSISTDGHSHSVTTGLSNATGTTSASSTGIYDASSTTHSHTLAGISGGNSHTHTSTEACTTNGAHTASSHGATGTHSAATGATGFSGSHTHGGSAAADSLADHTHTAHDPKMARVHFIIKT
jgi:microcystin-dependent protein